MSNQPSFEATGLALWSVTVYREYFGANDDRGYKFYAKEESDE